MKGLGIDLATMVGLDKFQVTAEPPPPPGAPKLVVEHRGLNRAERRARERRGYNTGAAVNKPYQKGERS